MGKITNQELASGASVANIGYVPLNKSGDTMSGPLTIPNLTIGTIGSEVGTNGGDGTNALAIQMYGNLNGANTFTINPYGAFGWNATGGSGETDFFAWGGSSTSPTPTNQPAFNFYVLGNTSPYAFGTPLFQVLRNGNTVSSGSVSGTGFIGGYVNLSNSVGGDNSFGIMNYTGSSTASTEYSLGGVQWQVNGTAHFTLIGKVITNASNVVSDVQYGMYSYNTSNWTFLADAYSGAFSTAKNTLDDGSGNSTVFGYQSINGKNAGSFALVINDTTTSDVSMLFEKSGTSAFAIGYHASGTGIANVNNRFISVYDGTNWHETGIDHGGNWYFPSGVNIANNGLAVYYNPGSGIQLGDNTSGQATPNKFIRSQGGQFQIINNAYTEIIMSVSDGGGGYFQNGVAGANFSGADRFDVGSYNLFGIGAPFVTWYDNSSTFGATFYENNNAVNIGLVNRSTAAYGQLNAGSYTIGLQVTASGGVYTGANNPIAIGSNVNITTRNTLDDGTGNMTIKGNFLATFAPNVGNGIYVNDGTKTLRIIPSYGSGSYNPMVQTGDSIFEFDGGSSGTTAALSIVPWTTSKAGIRITSAGAVQTTATTLDDGNGNSNFAGNVQAGNSLQSSFLVHAGDGINNASPFGQGAYIGWNYATGGTGETDFFNNRGGGSGGFYFYNGSGITWTSTGGGTWSTLSYLNSSGYWYASAYDSISDSRLKENVVNLTGALDMINKINGVYYTWSQPFKDHYDILDSNQQIGLIAQEVQAVAPEIVHEHTIFGADSPYLALDYGKLVPILVEAIKELSSKVDSLQAQIVALTPASATTTTTATATTGTTSTGTTSTTGGT